MRQPRRNMLAAIVAGLWLAALVPGMSAAQAQQPAPKTATKSEPIYGYQMMTPQERDEYRTRMRNARSAEERQSIRDEHHAAMQARAKERGLALPDRPQGAGPGGGRGGPPAGMGPNTGPRGPGMGPGTRRGPPEGMGPGSGPRGPGYGPGQRMGPPEGPAQPAVPPS